VPSLDAVAKLLPDEIEEASQVDPRRPWIVRYGSRRAVLRATDLNALQSLGFSPELAYASLAWLHELLRDLSTAGFTAPAPLTELDGQSIVVIDGIAWELLTFVPGRPMAWSDYEMRHAGALLASLHAALTGLSPREQRPGALPIESCRPADLVARGIQAELERELSRIGYERVGRTVVHGDATQANVVIEGDKFAFVDYTIAYVECELFDIASALWRNARVDANAVRYDPGRAALFVGGYCGERRLKPVDAIAIVALMKGRGLQLQQRLELRRGVDDTVLQRLVAICAQSRELVEAMAGAIATLSP